MFGGEAGASSKSSVSRADGTNETVPSKRDLTLHPGDELRVWTTGGGGYGDPLERDPARVLDDVLDRKVSTDAAAERYGVVVRDGTVDEDATREQRDTLTAQRGPVTWTFDRGVLGKE